MRLMQGKQARSATGTFPRLPEWLKRPGSPLHTGQVCGIFWSCPFMANSWCGWLLAFWLCGRGQRGVK